MHLTVLKLLMVTRWVIAVPQQMYYQHPAEVANGEQYFVCQNSGVQVPEAALCDGSWDCPEGEDESVCDEFPAAANGNEMDVPSGFVKLPDNLQQRQREFGGYGQDYGSFEPEEPSYQAIYPQPNYGNSYVMPDQPEMHSNFPHQQPSYDYGSYPQVHPDFGHIYSQPGYEYGSYRQEPTAEYAAQMSTPICSGSPTNGGRCPLPWIRPRQRFYFDSDAGACLPFDYSGCGNNVPNQYDTYDDCSTSCPYEGSATWADPGEQNYPEGESDPSYYYPPVMVTTPPDPWTVVNLTDANFDEVLSRHPRVMVEFHKPDCPKCVAFGESYEEVARESYRLGLGVLFARVNCNNETGLKERFSVKTFPKILLWDRERTAGPRQYYRSYGLTAENLLLWLRKQLGPKPMLPQRPMPPCSKLLEFQCGDSLCLPEDKVCDGIKQCRDGSDEAMCEEQEPYQNGTTTTASPPPMVIRPTKPDMGKCDFRCGDGTCQPHRHRCDGKVDCPSDGIDEANCGVCKRTQHTCRGDGTCVDYLKRCDGVPDCADGSDEHLCKDALCAKTEFVCADATCVSFALRCDGAFDCPDHSDEIQCPERCNDTFQFTCNNGFCVDLQLKCDGVPDCHDSTDELSCGANFVPGQCDPDREWECSDHRSCIDVRRRCDGYPDCADLSDEDSDMCPKLECKEEWRFQCEDKKRCIDRRRRCDGYPDCYDRSDESDCLNVACDYWQFKCASSGLCIDSRRRCDGSWDCDGDGSDELGCGDEEVITFPDNEDEDEIEPVYTSTTAASTQVDCPVICPLIYQPVCGSDGRTYSSECRLVSEACRINSGGNLFVVSLGECPTIATTVAPDEEEESARTRCLNYQWACEDGSCIELTKQCDGFRDCVNGEDEKFCSNTTVPTDDVYFACYDGQLLSSVSRCDGYPDCEEGEDETSCPLTTNPDKEEEEEQSGALCDPLDEFTCKEGSCRPIGTRCDGMIDCEDESDEFDCPNVVAATTTTTTTTTTTPITRKMPEVEEDSWFGGSLEEEEETLPTATTTTTTTTTTPRSSSPSTTAARPEVVEYEEVSYTDAADPFYEDTLGSSSSNGGTEEEASGEEEDEWFK